MTTSLAEQLRRLAVPQTSALTDSKKRASILFDAKEAANKDRSEIFDIGHNGLMSLIAINAQFIQYELTLFDSSAMNLQRAIESEEVNKSLNKTIRGFLYHLSPYFPMRSAHECLEWLIRRFHIHEYNKDELMTLILPYHETMTFVKCVQLMDLSNPNDPWYWLHPIQTPGVRLSKNAILNRAASNPNFLKFVCKHTVFAIKELGIKAQTLQVLIAFYCTTVIGAFEYALKITDLHIYNVLNSLLKGLSSTFIDFAAAAFMITAQLVVKTKLDLNLLNAFILEIVNVTHQTLQNDAVCLLSLMFQTQSETLTQFPEESLIKLLSMNTIITSLRQLSEEGVPLSILCVPVVNICLLKIQTKTDTYSCCKAFLDALLLGIHFKEHDAKKIIITALDSYYFRNPIKKLIRGEVIEIVSDDNDEGMLTLDEDVQQWYSEFLQKLERQYPNEFDFAVKETLEGNTHISSSRRLAFKTVLAFRLKSCYSEDNARIYENLYHHNPLNRTEAISFLLNNFVKLNISENSKDLLQESISDRLSDDNPMVVNEVLKFSTESLISIIGIENLNNKLCEILNKGKNNIDRWFKTTLAALKHFTNRKMWQNCDKVKKFIVLLPFLFPITQTDLEFLQLILDSPISEFIPVFQNLTTLFKRVRKDESTKSMIKATEKLLEHSEDLSTTKEILTIFANLNKSCKLASNYAYVLVLIKLSYLKNTDPSIALEVLELIWEMEKKFKFSVLSERQNLYEVISKNHIPLKLVLETLVVLTKQTRFTDLSKFDLNNGSHSVILRIFENLAKNAFSTNDEAAKTQYTKALKEFIESLLPTTEDKLEFLSNFFMVDRIDSEHINIEFQIRAVRVFNIVIGGTKQSKFRVHTMPFVKILTGLNSPIPEVRELTIKSLQLLIKSDVLQPEYELVVTKILSGKEEILLDGDQFSLMMCTIITPFRFITTVERDKIRDVFKEILDCITNENVSLLLKVELLQIIKHINNLPTYKKILLVGLETIKFADKCSLGNHDFVLDKWRSSILNAVALRFEESIVKILAENPNGWKFIEKCLLLYRISIQLDNQILSLATVVINIFDGGLFDCLPEVFKASFVELVIEAVTNSEDASVTTAGKKFIRRINLKADYIKPILVAMTKSSYTKLTKKRDTTGLDPNCFNTREWKNGTTVLELIQNKQIDPVSLIPCLFDVLKFCLCFEEQSTAEYLKQLILSCLLNCFQKLSSTQNTTLPDDCYRIDMVVQCIRATRNPQTQHHALLLLTQCALMVPDKVLHNMMDIFTFVGSAIVCLDDAFSFQVISNVIQSVVPTLIKASASKKGNEAVIKQQVTAVLKVFSDIIMDVPDHRRLSIYSKVIRVLDAKEYFWMFVCLVLESHIAHTEEDKQKQLQIRERFVGLYHPENENPPRVQFLLEIINEFDPAVTLETSIHLFEYLRTLPMTKADKKNQMEVDLVHKSLLNPDIYSEKQLRHYKYMIVRFISNLTSSAEFTSNVSKLNAEEAKTLKSNCQTLIINILMYVPKVMAIVEQHTGNSQLKFWKVLLHHCNDTLDNAISLLSPELLLMVVHGLMQHKLPIVRKRVIELLISKLQASIDFFGEVNNEHLLKLLNPLNSILDTILNKDKSNFSIGSANELAFIQQISLIAIKLLSKVLALTYPLEFKQILLKLSTILKTRETIPKIVLLTVVLCITEVSSNLKAQSIPLLSKFMPHLVSILQENVEMVKSEPRNNTSFAIITGMQKLFQTLPLFLNPYMSEILTALCTLWSHFDIREENESKNNAITKKLSAIWNVIATIVPLRILIPTCDQSYDNLVESKQLNEIPYLMELLKQSFDHASTSDITALQTEFTAFFLKTLEFRTTFDQKKYLMQVRHIEECILVTFVGLILKLSESSFRPLYYKVYDWALRDATYKERAITFFLLSCKVAEALKSLFVLFAGDLIQNAAELLDKCNLSKAEDLHFEGSIENTTLLVENILGTLNHIFLNDNKGFVNPHRFETLMQPLVDQLENPLILRNSQLVELLNSCLAQFAYTVASDTLWKQLNYQILSKTRNNKTEIRIIAFNSCVEIAKKLGENFSSLLPETIPFLAELLEDENEKVESNTKTGIRELEKILGESLQNYF